MPPEVGALNVLPKFDTLFLILLAGSGRQHLTSGFLDQACPQCGQRLHRLLRLDPPPVGIGITSRSRVEFAWCPHCISFTDAGYARQAPDGTPEPLAASRSGGRDREPESCEDWFIPPGPQASSSGSMSGGGSRTGRCPTAGRTCTA